MTINPNRPIITYENVALFQSQTPAHSAVSNSGSNLSFLPLVQGIDFSVDIPRTNVGALGAKNFIDQSNRNAPDVNFTINIFEDFGNLFSGLVSGANTRDDLNIDRNFYAYIAPERGVDARKDRSANDVRYYCVESLSSANTDVAVPYSGTTLYEEDFDGSNRTVLNTYTEPTGVEIAVTSGKVYYGDKPTHWHGEGNNNSLIPFHLAGKQFGFHTNRYAPNRISVLSLEDNADVDVYVNVINGINGTPTYSASLNAGETYVFEDSTTTATIIIDSTKNILCSKEGDGGDKLLLAPVETDIYRSKNNYEFNVLNNAPQTDSNYHVYDPYGAFANDIIGQQGQQLILNSGISGTRYAGYFNDNVNFSRATVQAQYYTNSIQQGDFGIYYTTEFVGFFRARHNGSYGFRVASDDASYLWIGDQATGGFTTSNATINNGGTHGNTSRSATVNLQSGKVYAFRAMQGENAGGANFNVYFTPPGGSETSDFAGYFYTYSGSNKIDPIVLNIQSAYGFYNFTSDASGVANIFTEAVGHIGYSKLTKYQAFASSESSSISTDTPNWTVVAPYPNTDVNISYYSGSSWQPWSGFNLDGTKTNPAVNYDFDPLIGVRLWKMESTKPVAFFINDEDNDKEILIGWNDERLPENQTSFGQFLSFGNCFLNNISISQSVNGLMQSQYSFTASNVQAEEVNAHDVGFDSLLYTGVSVPSIDLTGAQTQNLTTNISGVDEYYSNSSDRVVPHYSTNITISGSNSVGNFLIKSDSIQNFELELPINRKTIYSLGKKHPVARKALFPIESTFNFSNRVSSFEVDGERANLKDFLNTDETYTLFIDGTDYGNNNFNWRIDEAKLISQTYNSAIGSDVITDLRFLFFLGELCKGLSDGGLMTEGAPHLITEDGNFIILET